MFPSRLPRAPSARRQISLCGSCAVLLGALLPLAASAQLPSFPGAEGAGAYAIGGRGGDVYHVVNVNSSGAGSLADALATVPAAGRTIVFDVSGYIRVSGTLKLAASKVTIAGQTAPGDGIGITNGTFLIQGDDVIVRHFRFRDGYSADSLNLDSNSTNCILDHCDVMLSNDENLSTFNSRPDNFTFQWSINAWGMETHSCGGLWDMIRGSTHHTFWSHNHTRNPKARPDGLLEWVNNVTFDWDIGFIMGDSNSDANWKANVRGCYFICPPGNLRSVALEKANLMTSSGLPNFSLYLDDCAMDANGDGVLNVSKSGYAVASGSYNTMPAPFAANGVPIARDDSLTAYKKVLSAAGPLRLVADPALPLRDELDAILISNVVHQLRHHVSSPAGTGAGNGGFGTLRSAPVPPDTDRDGMPDFWETTLGSNAGEDDHNGQVPAGAFLPSSPAGYTLLEEYLHFLATPHLVLPKGTNGVPPSFEVDLHRYTAGFAANAAFTLAAVTNGIATLLADGHTVRFTAPTNFGGRARFDFTVNDGSVWTQTFLVLVSAVGLPRELIWRGDGSANLWNTNTANFIAGSAPAAFSLGDNVTFDDSGFNTPAVSLAGTLMPGAVVVDAAQNFTLGGSGVLAGAMPLRKSGPGTLTLATANSYGGGTTVEEGVLVIAPGADIGSGPLILRGGTVTCQYGATSTYTFDGGVQAPSGSTATLNLSPRATLAGLSGDGTLNLTVPGTVFNYDTFNNAFGGFSGTLNLTGTVANALLTANFNGGSFDGNLAGAVVNLDQVTLQGRHNSGGNTLSLGALTGTATAKLGGSGYAGNQTLSIGARNRSTTFAGAIENGVSTTLLNKVGTGTLTLSGTSTHSGATAVSAGTLLVSGALNHSLVTVATNATLAGAGALRAGVTVQNGGRVSPGSGVGAAGVLTVSNNLTLTTPALLFDLSSSPAGANDRLTLQGGLLTMSGTMNYQFNLLDGAVGPGTYTLMDGGTNTSAAGVALAHNLPSASRQTYALQRPASGNGQCYVRLVVTGNPASLVWLGTNGNAWDGATTNWLNGDAPERFWPLDQVTFNDTAASGAVRVAGVVEPAALVVSNATRLFTFTGEAIAGAARLCKHGQATLTLAASNTFTGGTFLYEGMLTPATDGALGSGRVTLAGGVLDLGITNVPNAISNAGNGTIHGSAVFNHTLKGALSGSGLLQLSIPAGRVLTQESDSSGFQGTLQLTGRGTFRINQGANLWGNPHAAFDLGEAGTLNHRAITTGATVHLGSLSGGSGANLRGSDQSAGPGELDTFVIGHLGTHTTFAGSILDGATRITALLKEGPGTLTLGGSNAFSGGVTVAAGTLRVENASGSGTGSGEVTVRGGATLTGAGAIAGACTFDRDATLSPGDGVGTLTFGGDLALSSGAVLRFDLGLVSDSVVVGGDLTLGGTLHVQGTGSFGPGAYTLFACQGAFDGALVLGDTPPGYRCSLDVSIPGQVRLLVTQPQLSGISINGGQVVLSGTGGPSGGSFRVLATTNLGLPLPVWTPLLTNAFQPDGSFTRSFATNPATKSLFYRLESF